jgi:hypothetical protein
VRREIGVDGHDLAARRYGSGRDRDAADGAIARRDLQHLLERLRAGLISFIESSFMSG